MLIPATTTPVWMSLGEPLTTLTITAITTMACVIIMWSGRAGTGCSTIIKLPRCQNHVLIKACVGLMSLCGSMALTHSWKMEWSPVRSVSLHGMAAVLTHPTRYESKPVLEITMFMSLSSQHFVQLTVQVGGYNHIHFVQIIV